MKEILICTQIYNCKSFMTQLHNLESFICMVPKLLYRKQKKNEEKMEM
jgi:hypothetical protein